MTQGKFQNVFLSLPLGTREIQMRKMPDSTKEPEYGNRLPYLRRTIIAKPYAGISRSPEQTLVLVGFIITVEAHISVKGIDSLPQTEIF